MSGTSVTGQVAPGSSRPLKLLAAAVAVVLAVVFAGSFALGWGWTGFRRNDTLWAWLHLLVLPLAVAAFPLWMRGHDRRSHVPSVALAAVLGACAALLLLGYELDWTWTGFRGETLWDWLNLLVLPAVLAVLPLWIATRHDMHPRWRRTALAVLVAFVVIVLGGYGLDWGWTGFEGNTLWDWMHLLLVPFVVPAVAAWLIVRAEEADERRRWATGGNVGSASRGVVEAPIRDEEDR